MNKYRIILKIILISTLLLIVEVPPVMSFEV